MNRPDLASLSDADLIRASSAGLFKRSARELASGPPPEVESAEGAVRLRWSEGVDSIFPAQGALAGAHCTCGAVGVCRHLIRGVLYLRDRAFPAPADRQEDRPAVDLLAMSEPEIGRRFGKASVRRALREVASGRIAVSIDHERRTVAFPTLGIRTQVPAGVDETGILCDCRQPGCQHAVLAVLWLRRAAASGRSEGPAPESPISPPAQAADAVAPVRRLLEEWLHVGVDGLSDHWHAMARTAALELDKIGCGRSARLLEAASKLVEAEQKGTGRADSARLRWTLAALWLRVGGPAPAPGLSHDTRSGSTRTYLGGSARTLVGVGTAGWWGEDLYGITTYLLDELTGEIVTAGTARPADEWASAPRLAAQAPVFAGLTAREIFGRRLHCSAVRLTDDGRISLDADAQCRLAPEGVDWQALLQRHGIARFRALAEKLEDYYPTVLHLRRPESYLFLPERMGPVGFDVTRQELLWPLYDADGLEAVLAVHHRLERRAAIERIQQLARLRAIRAIVGRWRSAGGRFEIEPITLLWMRNGIVKTHEVDLH